MNSSLRFLILLATAMSPLAAYAQDPIPPEAPWSRSRLPGTRIPSVYLQQWRKAQNGANCGLFAFSELGVGKGATPRAATFAGGWAVAYDRPGQRSAFGVAGTGLDAADGEGPTWPYNKLWSDGSFVGYGPEGGSGPDYLAYLVINGQRCLYNVWSKLGRQHLEFLLDALRAVKNE